MLDGDGGIVMRGGDACLMMLIDPWVGILAIRQKARTPGKARCFKTGDELLINVPGGNLIYSIFLLFIVCIYKDFQTPVDRGGTTAVELAKRL
ncbi:MAG: hypothetical protein WCS42_25200 [Verrucomicrobiota bacterium]